MAATLTAAGELTYASFPIDKVETDADGDLIVYGKASDGSIDSDQQIVDPSWMASAAQAWKESGANLRVQHNPQRDPAGVGLEVETDSSGATWVKGLVVEPIAKKLVAKGALRAYSVGIARPTITRDSMARGGRITDGELVEISLVDRPANKRCGIQLVKSADDGTTEYVNEVFGSEADIAKALGADVTKAAGADDDFVNVDLPKGASISISPADFAALKTFKQQLTVKTAGATLEADTEKRDIDTATRRRLASEGHALPDGSYPIENTEDLHNAAILARSGHGDAADAKRLIAREAQERGVANPLDDGDSTSKGTVTETAEKSAAPEVQDEAVPDVAKDPAPKPVKKAKKKKKLPPWLNKPSDGDDSGKDEDDSSCKGAHAWIHVGGDSPVPDIRCEKCKTTPAEAAGLSGTHDMTAAPVPELLESPPMASTKSAPTPQSASDADEAAPMDPAPTGELERDPAARVRSRHDEGLPGSRRDPAVQGRRHRHRTRPDPRPDLPRVPPGGRRRSATRSRTSPASTWTRSSGKPSRPPADPTWTGRSRLNQAWQAAGILKAADQAQVNDFRMEAHKAFRDANPGPTSAPTPGMVTPGKYNRPLITDGHEASSTGHDGPNSSPAVATSAPNAHSFDRPPLAAGHQSPSPSHMKGGLGEYPVHAGRTDPAELRGHGEGEGPAGTHADARAPVPPVPRSVPHVARRARDAA